MFILKIIGVLLVAAAIYWFLQWFNNYTRKYGNYEFFSVEHTAAYVVSYLAISIGYRLIVTNWKDDPLNGAIILMVGLILLILTIINNFKNTTQELAIKGTIAQLILYIPITMGIAIVIAIAFAYFSQTKPVYVVNGRD